MNALVQLRRGRLLSAATVLHPHKRVVHAHFRIDDPAPLIAQLLSDLLRVKRMLLT